MTTRSALAFVRKRGMVLMAARGPVPSLAEAIAGAPLRGSWWGHPRGRLMFRIFEALADSKEILVCRLVDGKITFVHRRIWPALVRLAPRLPKRGLAAVRQEHTESGRHRNVITPFPDWVPKDVRRAGERLDVAAAERLLGAAAGALSGSARRRTPPRAGRPGRQGTARRLATRLAVIALLVTGIAPLAGCGGSGKGPAVAAPAASEVPGTPVDAPEVPYATTYAGDIPCADCPGQRLALTLFPDGTWRMRRVYRGAEAGQDRTVYDLGRRGDAEDDRSRLVLRGAAGEPMLFRYVAGDRLQMLDREGNDIPGDTNDLLALQPSVDSIAGPMALKGLYTYMADAASFKDCATGGTLPILPVAGSSALQAAYLAARHAPGKPVLVDLTALFVDRAPEPGAAVREHLIVTQYQRVAPEESCTPPGAGVAKASPRKRS